MARVNVETHAMSESRFSHLMEDLKVSRIEAIGLLVIFWHDSQARNIWCADKDTILKLIPFRGERRDRCFDVFLDLEYISPRADNGAEYVIHGNRKHVEALQSRKASGSTGGHAKAKNTNKNKPPLALARDPLAEGEFARLKAKQSNTKQSKATQSNSDQLNSEKKSEEEIFPAGEAPPSQAPDGPKESDKVDHESVGGFQCKMALAPIEIPKKPRRPAKPVNPNSRKTWEAYSGAYLDRHGHMPSRNGRINSQIVTLVSYLGEEAAPVAAFYVHHNDAFYVRNNHAIGLLLRDYEKLRTDWKKGQQMTGSKAREVERQQHSSDNWDEAARILNDRRAPA